MYKTYLSISRGELLNNSKRLPTGEENNEEQLEKIASHYIVLFIEWRKTSMISS